VARGAKIDVAIWAVMRAKIQNLADEFVPKSFAFNPIGFRTSAKGALGIFTDAMEHHKRLPQAAFPRSSASRTRMNGIGQDRSILTQFNAAHYRNRNESTDRGFTFLESAAIVLSLIFRP
jgi:hypothetical protein